MLAKRWIAGALAALTAGAAAAQDATDAPAESPPGAGADITGTWSFRTTEFYNFGCEMDGQLVLEPTDEPGRYACFMVAEEDCPGIGRGLFIARQTCDAERSGAGLAIDSEVVTVSPDTQNYYPDDFELTIIDDSRMVGDLRSYQLRAPVEFYRGPGPVT